MHPLSIILFFTAFINIAIAAYTLRFNKSAGALAYFGLLVCISIYAFGYAMELNSKTIYSLLFWLRFQYLGISYFPTLNLLLAIQYTGKSKRIKPWMFLIFFSISTITLVLQKFNFAHLFYIHYAVFQNGNLYLANFSKGIWYWVHQIYSNITLLAACILYISMIFKSIGINRTRAIIMFFSLLIPWGFYIAYLLDISNSHFDLIPFSFSVVGILGALGMFRYKLLDFEPLALEMVFESMTDGVIILDKKVRLVNYNVSAQKIFPELQFSQIGKNVEALLSKKLLLCDFLIPKDNRSIDISIVVEEEEKNYQLKITSVNENKNRFAGWTLLFSDITERIKTEKTLTENARQLKELNATKDKFFAIIAHDLRNPFNILLNFSDMIRADIETDDKEASQRTAQIIYETSKSTYLLLQNLLEWAIIQRQGKKFNPSKFSIQPIINEEAESLRSFAAQKNIDIVCEFDRDLLLFADEQMLRTIVRNLLTNAIKYSFLGTTINLFSFHTNDGIQIEVIDKGIGMNEDELERLFKIETSFTKTGTASERGTGLGLILCYEFIAMHKGRIWAESEPGIGTTFKILFPHLI